MHCFILIIVSLAGVIFQFSQKIYENVAYIYFLRISKVNVCFSHLKTSKYSLTPYLFQFWTPKNSLTVRLFQYKVPGYPPLISLLQSRALVYCLTVWLFRSKFQDPLSLFIPVQSSCMLTDCLLIPKG